MTEHPTRACATQPVTHGRAQTADSTPLHAPPSNSWHGPRTTSERSAPRSCNHTSPCGGNNVIAADKQSRQEHAKDRWAGKAAQPLNRPSPCYPASQVGEAACSAPCPCWPWGTRPTETESRGDHAEPHQDTHIGEARLVPRTKPSSRAARGSSTPAVHAKRRECVHCVAESYSQASTTSRRPTHLELPEVRRKEAKAWLLTS